MQFTFLTLNLWTGGTLFDQAFDFLHQTSADIMSFQEVYDDRNADHPQHLQTFSKLKAAFPSYQAHFSPAFYDDQPHVSAEQGNATLSKFPIITSEVLYFDVPYGVYQDVGPGPDYSQYPCPFEHVTLDIEKDEPLHVFNVHGIWGLDGGDNPRRLAMSQKIIDQIQDKKYVILAGDFNLKPTTQTILNIEKYLKNVFKDELQSTFNMQRKDNPGYATAVVDMLFVSEAIQVVAHECPQVDISDHLPLTATLAIE
jgi:endonuclease/exonuclease/phosphatase family metal-dependent hydrolase